MLVDLHQLDRKYEDLKIRSVSLRQGCMNSPAHLSTLQSTP